MAEIQGVGHVSLTVTDLERAVAFYSKLFDAEVIMSGEDAHGPLTICASPSIMFGFRHHSSTSPEDRFDPARVGLDHVGFHVDSRDDLERWKERLDEQGVINSGIEDDQFGAHLNARDPDNIAIEFFAAAPSS
jgi:catechol 2,3-dioxygenase-like lactoylglutathione lyase family enzyme